MPVTSRRQQIRNINGGGKKGPNFIYNHLTKQVVQRGCGCVPFATNINVIVTTSNISVSWDPVLGAVSYSITLYSSLNYNVTTLDTFVITGTSSSNNITFSIVPTPNWYAAVVTTTVSGVNTPSPISNASVLQTFNVLYNVVGTYTHPLPEVPPGKSWNIAYELLGGGGGGGGGAPNIDMGSYILYGDAGQPGDDAILNTNSFTSIQPALTIIVVSDGGIGGAIGVIGSPGGNAFITDGVFADVSIGGNGGLPGPASTSLTPQTATPVSGNLGTGGKGGDSNTAGTKGVAGYVSFTATFVP